MLLGLVEDLRKADLRPRLDLNPAQAQPSGANEDARLEIELDGRVVIFAVQQKARAPYPNEVARLESLRAGIARAGHPLLVVPFVTAGVAETLVAAGWSWADDHGNYFLSAPGLRFQRRATTAPSRDAPAGFPSGRGSTAIVRQLIHHDRAQRLPTATELARRAQVSQPRASQVMRQLHALGILSERQRGLDQAVDREALLDRFLISYRGPGGTTRHLYSLDPPLVTAQRASAAGDVVVSADVGPDLLAPWRRPTTLVLYDRSGLTDQALGAVPAEGPESANVVVRTPRDTSVFPSQRSTARYNSMKIPLADPAQMVWDLLQLGGTEREEAAGVLREWILDQP